MRERIFRLLAGILSVSLLLATGQQINSAMLSAIDIGIYLAICAVLLYFSIKGNAGFNYPRLQFFVKSIDKK
ncbi:hypothetical protein [Shewanella baltica]|uniref:hypothetical protein n=1 Tax=Shewanella baltica TaxID=62322 RepID=UPI0001E10A4B|nr:hypothetical protein [Shewanella baltica]AEG12648.1 hypothetical protein Sbal175_3414 [Shewanella baltica BA175]EHQ13810.1 hypothetical protein Sbal183_0882 [Shewanella baltica OS183]